MVLESHLSVARRLAVRVCGGCRLTVRVCGRYRRLTVRVCGRYRRLAVRVCGRYRRLAVRVCGGYRRWRSTVDRREHRLLTIVGRARLAVVGRTRLVVVGGVVGRRLLALAVQGAVGNDATGPGGVTVGLLWTVQRWGRGAVGYVRRTMGKSARKKWAHGAG